MWEPYQRYRALDPAARKLFRRAVVLILLIRVSLRCRGYKKTNAWLQNRLAAQSGADLSRFPAGAEGVPLTCRMVTAGARYSLFRPTCLEQSLALWYFLREQGLVPKLRIGVRKDGGKFEAHAWVEYQEHTLNQPEETHQHYAAFDSEFSDPPGGLL
jgi:hypothetical protein